MNESSAQKRYLRKLRSRRRQTALLRISVFAGFLLLWEAAARLGWDRLFYLQQSLRPGSVPFIPCC